MALYTQSAGGYQFLASSPQAPFSNGVVALTGYEIVHATLPAPLPWRQGFARIARHLEELGRPRAALCALELRCPKPYTTEGFAAYNQQYRALLESWAIVVDGYVPAARSNVAPAIVAPAEQSLYAFSYTVASSASALSFVISGAAERPEVRPSDTSLDALREKTADVMATMGGRLAQIAAPWADVTRLNVYTTAPLHAVIEADILARIGPAAVHGIHWFYSRPPVEDLDIEMDVRCTRQEVRLLG
jgi:hypothetical protein